ncbi:MAG: Mov34/MPN/PAD-1 family protein [Rhodospirillales bacterium]
MISPAILIEDKVLWQIRKDGERRYPEESCGLLVGRRQPGGSVEVAEAHAGANVAPEERGRRFEIDPALRFHLLRALSGRPETIVGHYHSHPDRPAVPSAHDRAMAFEPDLVWLITAIVGGRAVETSAFRIDDAGARRLTLVVQGEAQQR